MRQVSAQTTVDFLTSLHRLSTDKNGSLGILLKLMREDLVKDWNENPTPAYCRRCEDATIHPHHGISSKGDYTLECDVCHLQVTHFFQPSKDTFQNTGRI